MFVGFIAVIVILLVIVGLMSTGATNGSGGVDQTKATKALSEVSALAQSVGFYKTTTTDSDYTGLTVQSLIDSGIVATADVVQVDTTSVATFDNDIDATDQSATANVVISKAVPGLYYFIKENATASTNFDIDTVAEVAKIPNASNLAAAIEKAMSKLSGSATVNSGGDLKDGAVNITF